MPEWVILSPGQSVPVKCYHQEGVGLPKPSGYAKGDIARCKCGKWFIQETWTVDPPHGRTEFLRHRWRAVRWRDFRANAIIRRYMTTGTSLAGMFQPPGPGPYAQPDRSQAWIEELP